jgi:DNA-binding transcriptional ArsR family regulator
VGLPGLSQPCEDERLMPYRLLAATELGAFLSAVAHPRRIQIVEELRSGERDVGTLQKLLGVTHSNVSQHLAVLRANRVVVEHRRGRQVMYRLCSPKLAEWLVEGMQFLPAVAEEVTHVKSALRRATAAWSSPRKPDQTTGRKGDARSEAEP